MRGRTPRPIEITALHGSTGRDSGGRKLRKVPKGAVVDAGTPPPPHLNAVAKLEWKAALAACADIRTLTTNDLGLIEAWAVTRSNFIAATLHLDIEGQVVTAADGGTRQNPWAIAQRQANFALVKLASELGFSPASRVRLGVRPSKEQQQSSPRLDDDGRPVPSIESFLDELKHAAAEPPEGGWEQ